MNDSNFFVKFAIPLLKFFELKSDRKLYIEIFALAFYIFLASHKLYAHHNDSLNISKFQLIENKNQWEPNIMFKAFIAGGEMYLEKDGITFNFIDMEAYRKMMGFKYLNKDEKKGLSDLPVTSIDAHAYKIHFVNGNTHCDIEKSEPSADYQNYYIGNDPSKWATEVRKYDEVTYLEIYRNIDLRVYSRNNQLKYELILHPGANLSDVRFEYEGVSAMFLKDGNLLIKTTVNKITELEPYAYQISNNNEQQKIKCSYDLKQNKVHFKLGEYDKNETLVIDPLLIFSTYSGSLADNWGYTATYDALGFLYAGGNVFALGYPTTTGAYQTYFGGASCDIAISKYDTSGHFMIYSTYLGGSGTEVPNSLIVDSYNNLCVMGTTSSANYPVSSDAFDQTFNGGTSYTLTYVLNYTGSDVVVTKFNSIGTALLASTFFGGSGNDGLNTQAPLRNNYADDVRGEIMIDVNDNIYIVATTQSNDLPGTSGTFQPNYGGGAQDGFIAKFDSHLSSLHWCSYLGGSANDAIYSIVIDNNQDIYVGGGTTSSNFSVTSGVLYTTQPGGNADGFITHIDKTGSQILHSTYYGSGAYDQVYLIENDHHGNIYALGQTAAAGSYYINNVQWYILNGGQFISKMSAELDSLIWSTAFGTGNGGPDISPTAFLVDVCDKIYLSGWGGAVNGFGGTSGLPITYDAFQTTTDNSDYYLMVMEDDASALTYATFFGGPLSNEHVDGGTSRFDKNGKIYQSVCAGCGNHDDFPTTPEAWSNTNNSSNCNNGVFKYDFMLPLVVADFVIPPVICAPGSVTFDNISHTGGQGMVCYWDFGDGTNSSNCNPSHVYLNSGVYDVTLLVSDTGTCNFSDSIIKQVVVLSNTSDTLPTKYICIGDAVQIGILPVGDPTVTFQWIPATYLTNSTICNPLANPIVTTTYTLLVSNGVCTDTLRQIVDVFDMDPYPTDSAFSCSGIITLTANTEHQANYFHWSSNNQFTDWLNSPSFNPSMTTTITSPGYFYIMVGNGHCTLTDSVYVDFVVVIDSLHYVTPSCYDSCDGQVSVFVNSGNFPFTYLWNTGSGNDTIYNLCAGNYSVTVTDNTGCISISSISLPEPDPLIQISESMNIPCVEACVGYIQLTINGGTPPYSYYWDNAQTSNPLTSLCEGTYNVTVTDSRLCYISAGFNIVLDYVFTGIEVYSDKDTIFQGQSTGLHATSIPGCNYSWYPADGLDNPLIANPVASPQQTTTYYLTITDPYGCTYTDTLKIFVLEVICDEPYIYVPNAFTPDGDGKNDVLYVRSKMMTEMNFMVYDRWGEKVFETQNVDEGWDGRYKGKPCDPAVFVYYLSARCHNETFFKKSGNVTLIR